MGVKRKGGFNKLNSTPELDGRLSMMYNKKLDMQIQKFRDYIQSNEWKFLRIKRFEKDNRCCVICKDISNLVCHHIY